MFDSSAYPISLNDARLEVVKSFNYLGVVIDATLEFKTHCNRMISSGNLKLYALRNLTKYLDRELLILLYKTMVLPVLEYGAEIIDSGGATLVKELQTIQNHCLRACLKIWDPRSISIEELHKECSTKMLKRRRCDILLCRMYRIAQQSDNVLVPLRVLRGNDKIKLKVQRPKGESYRKSPKYRGFLAWNKLKPDVQHLDSYVKFVCKVKNAV